jgi:hypothetical protein
MIKYKRVTEIKQVLPPLFILVSLILSCEKSSSIHGIWAVELVKTGEDEMIPNAK